MPFLFNDLQQRALELLPPELRELVQQHCAQYPADSDDSIGEAFVAYLENPAAPATAQWAHARARLRKAAAGAAGGRPVVELPEQMPEPAPLPVRERVSVAAIARELELHPRALQRAVQRIRAAREAGQIELL
jgi:hypothetical protein